MQSFLLTCLAEGRGGDDDEENNRAKGQAVVCNLTVAGVHEAVALSEVRSEGNTVSKQVLETAKRAVALTRLNVRQDSHATSAGKICERHMLVPAQVKEKTDTTNDDVLAWTASKSLTEWMDRYDRWAYEVFDNPKSVSPTQEQAEVLKVVHNRVTQEEYELAGEQRQSGWSRGRWQESTLDRPLLRLVHGLPGSGKSKLIGWLKEYFEEVWQWTRNKQYALIAPMNTMADNIGGSTMHSFGRIPFKDRRGIDIHPSAAKQDSGICGGADDWHELRFILLDEVEAAGAGLIGRLEENVRLQVPSTSSAVAGLRSEQHRNRKRQNAFAGVNVVCFGDFWQLDPTGDAALMSNPLKHSGCPYVDRTLFMFWYSPQKDEGRDNFHVQPWHGECRIWELSQNIRSGADEWLSTVLDECRMGDLKEENYNFLHGLPTATPIQFWYHRRTEKKDWHRRQTCTIDAECADCATERLRRNRWLNIANAPECAAQMLASEKFKRCMLITPFNKAVFQFSIHRAQTFAAAAKQQLFWMQAVDKPPAWFAGTLGTEELERLKTKWLQYHARKTEGVLSLCPCCHGMPMRITNGNSALCREFGIHNGTTCTVEGWELDPVDQDTVGTSEDAQVVLRALPRRLIIRMDRPLQKQYDGLPKDCFPLSPVTVYWTLDAEDSIEIHRRGFPVVPNFSTTIDGATGKPWTPRWLILAT